MQLTATQFFLQFSGCSVEISGWFHSSTQCCRRENCSGGQEHFYLETNATIAIPKTENEEMELITTSQAICKAQMFAAKALGVPVNRINVHVKRIGKLYVILSFRTELASL